ncbi:hypothetical protein [Rhizobium sp. BR 315]|uniref:hypothetical protein n=1 Tax=Rhizobium sp. BR 315 TaxID=3040014 RepID=UPI003D335A5F
MTASQALVRFAVYAQSGFRLFYRREGAFETKCVKSAAVWIRTSAWNSINVVTITAVPLLQCVHAFGTFDCINNRATAQELA